MHPAVSRRLLLAGIIAGPASLAAEISGAAEAQGAAERPTIAAAADLQFALTEIAAAFETASGQTIRLVFGSSGNFARQIRQGAPFAMYFSADERYVCELARDGFTLGDGAVYAAGRIVMMVPQGSPIAADGTLETLREALARGTLKRFAIANPDHAPYGRRAEEALRHAGLWEAVQPHLLFGENVSQAAQFAISANAQGGIIAYSLALAPALADRGAFDLIPAEWHSPLIQRMALLRGATPVAERFFEFMQQPEARTILRRFGFVLPGEGD